MAKKNYRDEEEEPQLISYERPSDIQKIVDTLPRDENCIQVYRMPLEGKTGRPIYLASVTPADLTGLGLIGYVKNRWGGGRFKFESLEDGDITNAGTFEVEGKPIIEGVDKDGEPKVYSSNYIGLPNIPLTNPNSGGPVPHEEFIRLREEILASKQDKVFELFKEILKSREESEAAAMSRIAAMKALFAPPQSSLDTKAIMDLVKEVLSMSAGSEGGSSIWPLLLDKLSPLLNQITGALARAASAPRGNIGMPTDYPPTGRGPIQGQVSPPPSGFQALAPMLLNFMPSFIMAASINKDPAEMVDLIVANIPLDKKDVVIQWLQSPDWFKDLVGIESRVGLQQGWWTDLHKYVLSVLLTGGLPAEEGEEQAE